MSWSLQLYDLYKLFFFLINPAIDVKRDKVENFVVYRQIHKMSFHLMQSFVFQNAGGRAFISKFVCDLGFSQYVIDTTWQNKGCYSFSSSFCFYRFCLWKIGFLLSSVLLQAADYMS